MRSILTVKFKKQLIFPIVILFSACFNDVLRIGDSKITIFRILALLGLFKCMLVKKNAFKYSVMVILFTLFTFLQSNFFYHIFNIGMGFSIKRFVLYDFFYICIFIIIWLIDLVRKYEHDNSIIWLHSFLMIVSSLYVVDLYTLWIYPDIRNHILLNNQNDYGAMLAATLPIIMCDYWNSKKKKYIVFSLMIIFILLVMDCKLSLLALFVQFFLMTVLMLRNKFILKNMHIFVVIPLLLFFSILIVFLLNSNVFFHGYNLKESVLDPIIHIFKGKMYGQKNTSVSYRVNVMIVGGQWMVKSKFLGMGSGNTGVLLRNLLGDQQLYDKWLVNDALSPHNVLVEVLLEFVFFSIIFFYSDGFRNKINKKTKII